MNKRGLNGNARLTMGNLVADLLWLLAWIVLYRQSERDSFAYISFAFVAVVFLYEMFAPGIGAALQKLIRIRMRKEQIRNAETMKRGGFLFGALSGFLSAALLAALSEALCVHVLGEPLFYLPLLCMAPSLFFLMVSRCLDGFLAGNGIPSYFSRLIHLAFFVLFYFLGNYLLAPLGKHMAALLRSEDYQELYRAVSMALAFTLSAAFAFLVNLVIYYLVHRQFRDMLKRDNRLSIESSARAGRIFFKSFFRAMPKEFLVSTLFAVQYILFWFRLQNRASQEGLFASQLCGMLLGGFFLVEAFLHSLFACICVRPVSEVASTARKEDYTRLSMTLMDTRHNLALTALPVGVFLSILAEPFCGFLFPAASVSLAPLWRIGGLCVYLGPLAFYQWNVCRELGWQFECNLLCAGGCIAALVCFFLLLGEEGAGWVYAFPVSVLAFDALVLFVTGFLLNRRLGVQEEFLKSFVYPFAVSALCALLLFAFSKALKTVLNDAALFLIGMILGLCVQSLLIVLLHNVSRREEKRFSGIFLIRLLGRVTGFFV